MAGSRRTRPRVMRPWEWSLPPRSVHLEVISAAPATTTGRPPLLLVPGLGHGAWCYAERWLGAAADRGFEAHALSLRGHGGSGGHTSLGRTTARGYVHDLSQAITALPVPPVIISRLPGRPAGPAGTGALPRSGGRARGAVSGRRVARIAGPRGAAQASRRRPGCGGQQPFAHRRRLVHRSSPARRRPT